MPSTAAVQAAFDWLPVAGAPPSLAVPVPHCLAVLQQCLDATQRLLPVRQLCGAWLGQSRLTQQLLQRRQPLQRRLTGRRTCCPEALPAARHTQHTKKGGAEQRRAEGEMDSHETLHHRHCLPHQHPPLYKHSQHSCPAHTTRRPSSPPPSCNAPAVVQCCWVKVGPHNRRQLHCCRVGECGAVHLLGNRPQEVKALTVGQHSTQRSKAGTRGSRGREERSSYCCCWCRSCCWCCCWCLTLLAWLTLHPRLC